MSSKKKKHLRKGKGARALPLSEKKEEATAAQPSQPSAAQSSRPQKSAEGPGKAPAPSVPPPGIAGPKSPPSPPLPPPQPRPPVYRRPMFWIGLVLMLGILASGAHLYHQYSLFADQVSQVLDVDTFYYGVRVDGMDLGGMTPDEAREALTALHDPELDRIGVTLSLDGEELISFDRDRVAITSDLDEVLEEAMAVGRTGSRYSRYEYVLDLPQNPVDLTVTFTVDPSPLEEGVRGVAEYLSREPVDAAVTGFHPEADTAAGEEVFTVQPEEAGRIVEGDELWEAVLEEFENETYGNVEMTYYLLEPSVTQEEVTADIQLLATVETTMTNVANRIHNIKLACQAVNGVILQPGETFSYNECLGPRTAETGYKEAGVITNGRSDTGMGGGICQVSSMVYVAAVKSDLTIVERNRHSYVLGYIDAGTDATVNYGTLDLLFTHTKDTPIYIRAWVDGLNITVEMYGTPREDGLTPDISTEVLSRPSPGDPIIVKDSSVPAGSPVVSSAHRGCNVKVYRIYRNAEGEIQEELTEFLHEDNYPAIAKEIRVNPADYSQYVSSD